MPEIIYVFDKPANWLGKTDLKEPPVKTNPVWGKLLRDIPILPDHISPDLEGWRYEAWYRMDPRIKKEDIEDRMPPASVGQHNARWSMRVQRFRENANVLGWVAKGGKFASEKQRLTQLLLAAGVPLALNTTRGITWGAVPNGPRIAVPTKLRWESCVEPAPAQAPGLPAAPAVTNTFLPHFVAASVPSLANTPVATAVSSRLAPLPSVTTTANTIAPSQPTNIPVSQVTSVHGTQRPINRAIPSPSSQPQPPPLIGPTLPRNPASISVQGQPIQNDFLDPQIFQGCPPNQVPTTINMNPSPSLPGQAGPPVNGGPSIPVSSLIAPRSHQITDRVAVTQQPHCRVLGPLSAIGFDQGAAATSSTNPGAVTPESRPKRKRDGDEDASNVGPSNGRISKKPRRAPTAVGNSQSQRRFRTRFPRTTFGGITQDMPQSLNEWIQVANASHVAEEAGLARNEQIQPARPSDGYQQAYIYLCPGGGDVFATPEDFLHSDAVDAARQRRHGCYVRETSGVNAGGFLWVQGAEGVPVDYYRVSHDNPTEVRLEASSAPANVQYTPQEMGWYLSQLPEGDSHILAQDPLNSDYPPLD
jgi:hypothetical protein